MFIDIAELSTRRSLQAREITIVFWKNVSIAFDS
jgi:hypothetical protein